MLARTKVQLTVLLSEPTMVRRWEERKEKRKEKRKEIRTGYYLGEQMSEPRMECLSVQKTDQMVKMTESRMAYRRKVM
jgi:hypothetical protein